MCEHAPSLALVSLVLLASNARGDKGFINSCGTIITQPGTYHLAQNLTCTSGPYAVDIEASDVEFRFDDHTLTGGGIATTGSGVGVGTSNAGISNVSIVGGGAVIDFGAAGIVVGTVASSFVFDIRIVNVTASQNGAGIELFQTVRSALISNAANDNKTSGIQIEAFSVSDTLRSNQTNGNGNYGIEIASSCADNLLEANKANANLTLDFFEKGVLGRSSNCLNTWKSNEFSTAFPACIK